MSEKNMPTFSPAQTKRTSEVIYDQISQKIFNGELKDGDRLPSERELALQFGRGRQSVREALRMLQQDGLIRIALGNSGGAYVQRISLDTVKEPLNKLIQANIIPIEDVMEYRKYNDEICAELAIRNHTEEDLQELEDVLEQFKESVGNRTLFPQVDTLFHRVLARSSHNQLVSLINEALAEMYASTYWNKTTDLSDKELRKMHTFIYKQHVRIKDALRAKDKKALIESMASVSDTFHQGPK